MRPPALQAGPAPLPRRRRWLFIGITLASPWVLLVLVEVGLRVVGYGSSYPLFVPFPARPEYLVPNQDVAKRYFGAGPFTPTPLLDFFRAHRGQQTFRIIFQGESSAQGFPYEHGGAPSRMLEVRLQATFPSRDIEIINTALTATNSYTLLDQTDEIIGQHPDAVLIYAGHNEYYGVFGVASARALSHWRPLIMAYLALRRLRTVQLAAAAMTNAAEMARARTAREAPRTVMQLMAGEQGIPFGSRRYTQGLDQFRSNLSELLSRYRAHRIPVLIGTVASNERDQPPFVSRLAPGTDSAAWWRSYRTGLALLARGDTAGAARALETAIRLDSAAADGFYALGQVREAEGAYAQARSAYRAAKDRDQLRFRAPEAINQIIRDVAARHGATVVETQQALERVAPEGLIGHTLILEHLHPTVDGYFVIADAFYEAMRQRGLVGAWTRVVPRAQARQELPVTAVDSLIGLLRANRLVSGWPFRPKGAETIPIVDTLRPRTPVEQLAQGVVLGRLSWPAAMDQLRISYERAGSFEQATRVALAMAEEYRYSAQPFMDAAHIAVVQHHFDEALGYVRAAIARQETANNVQLAGLLLLRLGDQAAAMPYLQRAAQLDPGEQRMIVPLRAAEVLPGLERERARVPGDTTVLYQLSVAYALTQQYEKARAVLIALERVAPNHRGARDLLRQLPPDGGAVGTRARSQRCPVEHGTTRC